MGLCVFSDQLYEHIRDKDVQHQPIANAVGYRRGIDSLG